ncbi:hypothetical protein GCM10027053_02290 [Intrasporangium mesophilum]
MSRSSNEGLSIPYRIGYQLRMLGLSLFGPAQLSEQNDPKTRLFKEREAKVAAARARREAREGTAGSTSR